MRIAALLVRHEASRISPILPDMLHRVGERGVQVDVRYPDEQPVDADSARVEHDLYLLKAKSPAALAYAGALHDRGATIVNPYPVTALCRDKVATTQTLAAAGVPVPATYPVDRAADLLPLLKEGPLILKPSHGSQGRGVRTVHSEEDLRSALADSTEPLMAQRYHEPDGRDRKVYRIADEYFCVVRPWPPTSYADKLGELEPVDGRLRELAQLCGSALGIDLYGVDVIYSNGQPVVVDLSSFPGFKGVPDAARRLADYVYAAACAAPSR